MQLMKGFLCVWVAGIFMLPTSVAAWSNVGVADYYRISRIGGITLDQEINAILNNDIPPKVILKHLIGKCAPSRQYPIAKGDCFSINLSTAFVGKFLEFGWKGEVAVVARVSERQKGSLEFGSDAYKSGRVIYFGNDVRQGQQLNFSYLPMYGPMIYDGRPVDVQLYVIEIDHAEQFKPLLDTLAQAGTFIYPPAAPVLKILDAVGGALLSATKDDNIMDYSFCLNPRMPYLDDAYFMSYGEYPVFEAGHYVVIRRQDRKIDMGALAKNLYYDSYAQLLKCYDSKTKTAVPYTEDSYMVVHVKRELESSALKPEDDFYVSFEKLRQSEKKLAEGQVNLVKASLDTYVNDLDHDRELDALHTLYERVGTATAEKAAIAKLDASELLFGIQAGIEDREACTAEDDCPKIPTKRELMELLALMRASTAFSTVTDELTYEELKTKDPARDMVILNGIEAQVKTIQQ